MAGASEEVHYTYQHRMKRCTRPSCEKGCRTGTPSHGPYWYAYWREGNRVRSRYLGKQAPPKTSADRESYPPPLRVQTLGVFGVSRGDEYLPVHIWGPRMRALFALLLESVERPRTREQIADALWPDLERAAAAKAVRQTLARLRKTLDRADQRYSYLPSQKQRLTIDPAPKRSAPAYWWDAQTFRTAASGALIAQDLAQSRKALAGYGGEYLPGEDLSPVEHQRVRLRALYHALLMHQARIAAVHAEMAEAEDCLGRLLVLDPVHEEAGRMLMLLLAQSGRRTEALKVYQDLERAIDEELGIAPDAQTRRLAVTLTDRAQRAGAALPVPSTVMADQRGNLPHAAGSFVGRQAARVALAAQLNEQRLVTLSGIGGIGKSTLALQVGHDLREQFPDGVWWVEFAGLPATTQSSDPGIALLAPALVQTLGIEQGPNQSIAGTLEHFLQSRRLLLILDNCEHVRAPVAVLVSQLLSRCPDLRILLTSRAQLDLPEEFVWPVPPFTLPEPGADLQTVAATEAVQFFVTRARAVRRNFRLDAVTAAAVLQICRRLDGIPLALEFAAVRLRLLDVDVLASRLDDRFRLLASTNPLALPRQQTLRTTLDWSYALLPAREQILMRRLAIFSGGWTLHTAEIVCSASPLDSASILDLLDFLVRHSLVLVDSQGAVEETRYQMLETVREYGLLRLESANEQVSMAAAHRRWCVSLARQAEPQLRGREQVQWSTRLEAEHENLQAALAWSCAEPQSDPDSEGLNLATAIWQFWYMRNHYRIGRTWFDRLFGAFPAEVNALWAKALNAAGGLALHDDDPSKAKVLLQASLDAARQTGDRQGAARALTNLAAAYHSQDAYAEAEAGYEEALIIFREFADRPNEVTVLSRLGALAKIRMDYKRADSLLKEALSQWKALGHRVMQSHILDSLADLARRSGELEQADLLAEEAVTIARDVAFERGIAFGLRTRGVIAKARSEYIRSAHLLYESLEIAFAVGAIQDVIEVLNELAGVVVALLQAQQDMSNPPLLSPNALLRADTEGIWAVRLLGAAAAGRTAYGRSLQPETIDEYEADLRMIRQQMKDAAFSTAWTEGSKFSVSAAVNLAREGLLYRIAMAGGSQPDLEA